MAGRRRLGVDPPDAVVVARLIQTDSPRGVNSMCSTALPGSRSARRVCVVVSMTHAVVVGHREVDPHLAAVGPRHHEHRLAGHGDAADFLPGVGVDHQHLVAADGGQVGLRARPRPSRAGAASCTPAAAPGPGRSRPRMRRTVGLSSHRSTMARPSSPNRPAM